MTRRLIAAGALTLLLASVPAALADVHIGINIGPPAIVLPAPPELVVVPGSPVYYAPAVPYNFFYYGGLYYVFDDGHWFASRSSHGPWGYVAHVPRPILGVPVRYYHAPPGHWKKHGPPPWAGHGRGHDRGHSRGRGHGHGHHD